LFSETDQKPHQSGTKDVECNLARCRAHSVK
jgi:hypothetical protein